MNELAILFGAGALVVASRANRGRHGAALRQIVPAIPIALAAASSPAVSLSGLFWIFLKIGSVLFGSGYVLLAFLRADLVDRLHWLTEAQLIDAVAAGQVTSGPVFTTATFIGYVLAGPVAALVSTAGIFLPALIFVAISGPLVPRLRASKVASGGLDDVNVASLALMAVVAAQLGRAAMLTCRPRSLESPQPAYCFGSSLTPPHSCWEGRRSGWSGMSRSLRTRLHSVTIGRPGLDLV